MEGPKSVIGVSVTKEIAAHITQLQEEVDGLEKKRTRLLALLSSDKERFVSLNVGGKVFTVANSTLNKEVSFLSALTARSSPDGEVLMVDGDADAFSYVLAYLRHGVPVIPPDRGLQQILLLEAKYYSLDGLVNALIGCSGGVFPYEKYLPERFLKEKSEEDVLRSTFVRNRNSSTLNDPFVLCVDLFGNLVTTASSEPVPFLFPHGAVEPCCATVTSLADFERNLSAFCGNWISEFPWNNVVLAGGAVLACAIPPPPSCRGDLPSLRNHFSSDRRWSGSDVDLFIHGLTTDEATVKVYQILQFFQAHALSAFSLFIRTEHAITIECGLRRVQIILRLYKSPAEVIMGFDLDSCAALYDGHRVMALPRFVRSLQYGMNLADPSRQSLSYVHRLVKYAKRGFSIGVPGLDRTAVKADIFSRPVGDLGGLARLLVLEAMFSQGYENAIGRCTCAKNEGTTRSSVCSRHHSLHWIERRAIIHAENRDELFQAEQSNQGSSNYATVFLPCGPYWNESRLESLLTSRAIALSKSQQRVPFVHSREPDDIFDTARMHHATFSISRELKWMTENPGAQLTGSFHLLDENFYRGVF